MDDFGPIDRTLLRLTGLRVSTLLFLPNNVVVMQASAEQFRRLHLEGRYDAHVFMTYAMAAIMVLRMLSLKAHTRSKKTSARIDVLCILGAFVAVIVMYVMVAALWKSDPAHTVPIYPELWYDGATPPRVMRVGGVTNSSTARPPEWVCTMSDVITRAEALALFTGPLVLAVALCYGLLCVRSAAPVSSAVA